jgi:hypothetical protein
MSLLPFARTPPRRRRRFFSLWLSVRLGISISISIRLSLSVGLDLYFGLCIFSFASSLPFGSCRRLC